MMNEELCRAVAGRVAIAFFYKGKKRLVEPHLVGTNADGCLVLSAWQTSGGSGEGWRDYFVDQMSGVEFTSRNFSDPRPGYNPNDKTIVRVICRI